MPKKTKSKRGIARLAEIDLGKATEIHSLGGLAVAKSRSHMREIGRLGGLNSAKAKARARRKAARGNGTPPKAQKRLRRATVGV